MEIIYAIHIFFLGAIFASFLNLAVYRLENEYPLLDIIKGRSFCEDCKRVLRWYELIPVFSFIFLRGKCLGCKSKIRLSNFLLEIILGSTFTIFFLFNINIIFYVFLLILYFWFVYDLYYQSIPKNITDFILIASLIYWIANLIYDFDLLKIYPVIISLGILLIIVLASLRKKLFGLGDLIVLLILAFWLQMDFFLNTLLYSIVIGGLFSIGLVLKDRKYFKKYIPFLPFVFFGFVLSVLLVEKGIQLFDYILTL
jgi:prepilin signal peptidase PulO-like enzyme (type II secretory pathway)